jgi:hypothetical protein
MTSRRRVRPDLDARRTVVFGDADRILIMKNGAIGRSPERLAHLLHIRAATAPDQSRRDWNETT